MPYRHKMCLSLLVVALVVSGGAALLTTARPWSDAILVLALLAPMGVVLVAGMAAGVIVPRGFGTCLGAGALALVVVALLLPAQLQIGLIYLFFPFFPALILQVLMGAFFAWFWQTALAGERRSRPGPSADRHRRRRERKRRWPPADRHRSSA